MESNEVMDMVKDNESIIERYQRLTMNTAVYPEAGLQTERELNYLIMGMIGEAGEIANKFKKFLRNNLVTFQPKFGDGSGKYESVRIQLTTNEIKILTDEMGDVLWYFARICSILGVRIEEVAMDNYFKLNARKDKGELKDHK